MEGSLNTQTTVALNWKSGKFDKMNIWSKIKCKSQKFYKHKKQDKKLKKKKTNEKENENVAYFGASKRWVIE